MTLIGGSPDGISGENAEGRVSEMWLYLVHQAHPARGAPQVLPRLQEPNVGQASEVDGESRVRGEKGMIIPGTEHLKERPWIAGSKAMGITSYGRSVVNGLAGCYKAGLGQSERLENVGYLVIKRGTGYCYVIKRKKS